MNRNLALKRERLTELTPAELTQVAGGYASGITCPLDYCISLTCNTCNCCTASGSC